MQLAPGYAERGHDVAVHACVTDRAEGTAVENDVRMRTLWTPKPRMLSPYPTPSDPFVARKVGDAFDALEPRVVRAHSVRYLLNAILRAAPRRASVVEASHDVGTAAYGEPTGYLKPPRRTTSRFRPPTIAFAH